ncbi:MULTISPECIES: GMC family oxidoreductase [unclassified Sinorhizobium]|uniref:GMC family oxidoreductase n=1 Tax=unclassified Sinorhizobium TaxID=2613772 RepID=UPI003524AB6F
MTDGVHDVAIIGSGFAGSLIAHALAEEGLNVVIVEAGGAFEDERHVRQTLREAFTSSDEDELFAPYAGLVAPQPRGHKAAYYVHNNDPEPSQFGGEFLRLVGGSGLAWLGTALRMCPNDFRMQSAFGRGVDWPISYPDLEPWYCKAEQELGVAGEPDADTSLGSYRSQPFPMPAIAQSYADRQVADRTMTLSFETSPLHVVATAQARNSIDGYNGRPLCEGYASCVPLCPVGAKYDPLIHLRRALLSGAELLPEAIVTQLDISDEGRVTSAVFRRADGSTGTVYARTFVLAANGIETPRLLLLSNQKRSAGLANESGQVGRNLMDHPEKHSCAILPDPIFSYRGPQSTSSIETLRDGPFRKHRAAFRTALRNDGWRIANGAPSGQSGKALHGTLIELVEQRGLFGRALRSALEYLGPRQFALQSVVEMLPNAENRVSLSPSLTDELGSPRPVIRFRIGSYERDGIAAAARLHARIFDALGCRSGDIFIDLQEKATEPDAAGSHIMGTTIMGKDPATSVVDPNCRTHDHHNLFIVGSSVFPTGAAANPTLTISALALRAAQYIKGTMRDA